MKPPFFPWTLTPPHGSRPGLRLVRRLRLRALDALRLEEAKRVKHISLEMARRLCSYTLDMWLVYG